MIPIEVMVDAPPTAAMRGHTGICYNDARTRRAASTLSANCGRDVGTPLASRAPTSRVRSAALCLLPYAAWRAGGRTRTQHYLPTVVRFILVDEHILRRVTGANSADIALSLSKLRARMTSTLHATRGQQRARGDA